jgi:hypothetical protein
MGRGRWNGRGRNERSGTRKIVRACRGVARVYVRVYEP